MKDKLKLFDGRQVSSLGYILLGIVLLIIGGFCYAMGTYIIMNPIQEVDMQKIKVESQQKCLDIAHANNFKVEQEDNRLIIKEFYLNNPKARLYTLENTIARCTNYQLENLCYGISPHCESNGLTASLKYYEPIIYKNN
tara:strand:+ start:40320 stop:40736 length:417 start_codon:yes stop_codon:yes gene_type:complete